MVKIGLMQLWGHKRRLLGTFLAILLGTAFLSGTLILGDTLRSNFDTLFSGATAGTDVVVRSASAIEGSSRARVERVRAAVPDSLLGPIRRLPGVAAAEPSIRGYGQLIGRDGKAVGGNGPPRIAGNWISDPDLNPYHLVAGRAPRAPDEVVINRRAAEDGGLSLGQTATVQTPQPLRVRIVGIATFGSTDGFGRATFTGFTLEGAERYVTRQPDRSSSILVRAAPGISQAALASRIRSVVPSGVQVLTGTQFTQETIDEVSGQFLDLFRAFLVVFAGVALLVTAFGINNAFSIILAQRTRESALLRAVGAARSQVLGAVVLEALVVGASAAGAGLLGGLGVAGLLKGVFDSFGFALPAGGVVFRGSTVAVTMAVGIVVTLVGALAPAVRWSRVPPLAALRDVSVDRSGGSRVRLILGTALTVLGVVVVVTAVMGAGGALGRAGLGALLVIAGVVALGPVVAGRAAWALGAALPRVRGMAGTLARENASRNPRRTAGTAAALMVGVAVVTLFTVFVASLKVSIQRRVSNSFGADLAITAPSFGGGGLSPQLASAVRSLPEVGSAVGIGSATVRIAGQGTGVSVADPAGLAATLDLQSSEGSIGDLGSQRLAVSQSVAEDHGWHLGTPVRVAFVDGAVRTLTLGAVYQTSELLGDYVLPEAAVAGRLEQPADSAIFVRLRPGVGLAAAEASIRRVARPYGAPAVEDRQGYLDSVVAGPNLLLGLIYVMLALAILIALMGIANTVSLSIVERIRELGLLRAVGATRGQVRSMVRWESTIIAVIGTVAGLAVGLFLGWALVRAASRTVAVFAAPPAQLVVILVVGAVAGLVAGLRPARRAAGLDLMPALAAE